MRTQLFAFAICLFSAFVSPPHMGAQSSAETQPAENPLTPFERLVGGQWHLEGSYQEFEWGVGRQSVRSRAFFLVDGEAQLVSEGSWFWHPGEENIKGYFTAVEMPVNFFDYTTRFEGNKMVSDLRTFDALGNEDVFVETWEFVDETRFLWKLLQETPEGLTELMSGTYSKKLNRPLSH